MAIFHMNVKAISRSGGRAGRSATGAAAYRAGVEITDTRTGIIHDYSRKRVEYSEMILPNGGTIDRAEFWNSVEHHHKRGDAVLLREVEVSLPIELTAEQNRELAVAFARELADKYCVAADIAIHTPKGNPHAHISLSACHADKNGHLGKKANELDPIHCQRAKIKNLADHIRGRWADKCNVALADHGHNSRIDHRTLDAQGIDREPTKHKGVAVTHMDARGIKTDVSARLDAARQAGEAERDAVRQSAINIVRTDMNIKDAIRERKNNEQQQRAADPRRQLAPGPRIGSVQKLWECGHISQLVVPSNLLQSDAFADLGQQRNQVEATARVLRLDAERILAAAKAAALAAAKILVSQADAKIEQAKAAQAQAREQAARELEQAQARELAATAKEVEVEMPLLDRLKESFDRFVKWISGSGGECVEVNTVDSWHSGPVVQRDDLHCLQKTGRGKFAIHELAKLDKVPSLNDQNMDIKYRDGVGKVVGKLGKAVER